MLKNYFKIALRSFLRDKTYALINLLGLTVALASVFVIIAYVNYELSYDRYYSNSERIYRLVSEKTKGSVRQESVVLPQPLAPTLRNEFPEIEAVSFLQKGEDEFQINNEPVKLQTLYADSSFFQIFNLAFINGGATSFKENNNIIISEKIANTFFPKQNPVGLNIISKNYKGEIIPYKITGIIKNIPGNTHFTADVIIANIQKEELLDWKAYRGTTQYILLKKHKSINNLSQKISSIYKKYDWPDDILLSFQPVISIHLHSNILDELFANSNIKYIYIFSFVGILILLIACINYINLTTARSLQRVREVGVRKVIGAEQKQLAFQFISESVLFFSSTLPFAFVLAYTVWPLFTKVVNIQAAGSWLFNWKFIVLAFSVSLFTGILSGLYPAFFLSKLKPINILKDWQKGFRINMNIRKALIVFQFSVAVTLIISTIIVYSQLHLLNNMPLGFNKENLIILPWQRFDNKSAAFKNELKQNSNIKSMSVAGWKVGERYGGSSSMDNPNDTTKELKFAFLDADFDFIKTMQIKIIEGRDFSTAYSSDTYNIDSFFSSLNEKQVSPDDFMNIVSSQSIIVTEQTIKALQLKPPFTGQKLRLAALQGTIIGIVNNFLGISLEHETPPLIIRASQQTNGGFTYIRIAPYNVSSTIDFIQTKWKKFFPDSRFEFSFVDDRLQQLYNSESRLASIFNLFAGLAIFIATLGLFSLVALTVQHKTKEIGIRKVLGASVTEIVQLLSKDFVKLVMIAILIASPIAWWAMNKWLEDFIYRINISWWSFLIAGTGCLLLAIITVAFQAIKAAIANPIKSLRTE